LGAAPTIIARRLLGHVQRPGTAPAAPRWLVHMIAGTVLSDRPCASIKPSLQG